MADPDYHAAIRKGYEWGVKEERERILARLEEWKTDDCGNCPRCAANREIIWIVEGENE